MKSILLMLVLLAVPRWVLADIIEIDNFAQLSDRIKQELIDDTLVLFDVDDVIIAPTDPYNFRAPIRKKLNKELRSRYSKEEIQYIFSDFFSKRDVKLVNAGFMSLLDFLGKQKTPTAALSSWWTGEWGSVAKMEDLRFRGLDQVGVSFQDISPFKTDRSFPEMNKENGGTPMVISGVILTALSEKGEVLKRALDAEGLTYARIIFVDDNIKYLKSVQKTCKEMKINFVGIHYTEAKTLPIPSLSESKEQARFKYLEENRVWQVEED